jgi:hypothetical protein
LNADGKLEASNFIVVDFSLKHADAHLIPAIVQQGFDYDGKVWKPVLRSASQARSFKCVFTSLDPSDVRHDIPSNANFANKEGKVSPAKKDAYAGNAMASSKVVGKDYFKSRC